MTDARDRAIGAVVGLAVGDALGAPFEFRRASQIPVPLPAFELPWMGLPPGTWTDDTAMARNLWTSLIEHDGALVLEDVLARHQAWLDTDPPDVGNQTRAALLEARRGIPEPARAVFERRGPEVSAGNGSVMSCAPLGVVRAHEPERLRDEAPAFSALTHWDGRCRTACLAVTWATAALVRGDDPEAAVGGALVTVEGLEGGEELEHLVAEAGRSRPIDGPDMGFTLFCAGIALQVAGEGRGFEDGLRHVVAMGGDTDTNAAVAGALLGAAHGVGAIPAGWLERLAERDPISTEADALASAPGDVGGPADAPGPTIRVTSGDLTNTEAPTRRDETRTSREADVAERIQVYGASWCGDCRRAKRFLGDQRIAYDWHDIEQDASLIEVVQGFNDGRDIIPTIVFPDGSHLAEPTNEELADKLGLDRTAMQHVYDVIIIGGGPAGLTTSIYAARENLDTLIIDSKGLGGQAGVTERLDNYPGFPEGIGGAELADRIVQQARRYGVEMLQALSVTSIAPDGDQIEIVTSNDEHYHARAVVLATGSSYRRTGAEGEDDLIGAGIHFCATCDGPFYRGSKQLMVLGGGNSGLEEGLFLRGFTERVTVVEYKDRLAASQVLQDKVAQEPEMEVLLGRRVVAFGPKEDGSGKVGTVILEEVATGEREEHHPDGVFVFIGLDPNTGFLDGVVDLDDRGFVVTDAAHMTSMPGVFAAGDVRGGSTKQLASAVGEGASVAIAVRAYLQRQLDMAGT